MFVIVGDLPSIEDLSVEGICCSVFERILQSDDIIDDLSLPERLNLNSDFELTLSKVRFELKLYPDFSCLPMSTTLHQFGDDAICAVVHINYTTHEAKTMPAVVKARILREATHAIRCAMIDSADTIGVSPERLMNKTPPKGKAEFRLDKVRNSEPPLYKLEYPEFQSGHYMEHVLLGGVWTKLCGKTYSDSGEIMDLPAEGLAFKIVRRVGKRSIRTASGTYLGFVELEGCDATGAPARMLHCSLRRGGEGDECAAVLM